MDHIKLITAATATVAAVTGLYYLYNQLTADSAATSAAAAASTTAAQSASPPPNKSSPTPSPAPASAATKTPAPAPVASANVKPRSYASIASASSSTVSDATHSTNPIIQPVKHEAVSAPKPTNTPTTIPVSTLVPATVPAGPSTSASSPLPSCFAPLLSFFPRFKVDQPSIRIITAAQLPPPYNQLLDHTTNMTPTLSAFWCHQEVGLHVLDRVEVHSANQIRRWIKLEVADNVCELSSDSSKQALADKKKSNSTWAAKLKQQQSTPVKKTFASPKPGRLRFQESMQKATPTPSTAAAESTSSALAATAPTTSSSSTSASSFTASAFRTPVEFGSIHIHLNNIPESLHPDLRSGAIPFATLLKKQGLVQKVQPQNFFSLEYTEALCKALNIPYYSDIRSLFGRCNIIRDERDRIICEVVEIIPPIHMDS